jgi:predicted enzyme related to lactoylglutathione lyase
VHLACPYRLAFVRKPCAFAADAPGSQIAPSIVMSNPQIHWELMVRDPQRAREFYAKVFDWTFQPAGPEYTLIDTGTPPGGGLLARPPHVAMSMLNTYFQVADLDRTIANAIAAGGTSLVPRMEIPGVGSFAMFQDPEGIPIGVMQPLAPPAGPSDDVC